jgi:hypothetical protein
MLKLFVENVVNRWTEYRTRSAKPDAIEHLYDTFNKWTR